MDKKEVDKLYYQKNKVKILEKNKLYYQKNKVKILEKNKLWLIENRKKDKIIQDKYKDKNKEIIKEKQKIYYKKNKDKEKLRIKNWNLDNPKYFKEYNNKRLKVDINYKLRCWISCRINIAIKNNRSKKAHKTIKLLGCSIQECREHLEKQFKDNMSWDNYGKWHIDHIIPCAIFDLTKEKEQLKCFNYKNIQPLWAEENMSKGCKIQ